MTSTTLPVLLAVIAAILCFAPGSFGLVTRSNWGGGRSHNNEVSFTFTGSSTKEVNWKMSAYANSAKTPINKPQVMLVAESTGKDANLKVDNINLPGYGGCAGEKEYPCLFVTVDGAEYLNQCINLAARCISEDGGSVKVEENNGGSGDNDYSVSMGFAENPDFVEEGNPDIKVKFTYKGGHIPGNSGKWKMFAYGSSTDNPGREDLIVNNKNILSTVDQDQGDRVDFTSKEAVLKGMNGCSGENWACFIVYRGTTKINSKCMKFSPSCPVHQ